MTIRKVDTGGRRNEIKLTDVQEKQIISYATQLGLPEDKIYFRNMSTQDTGQEQILLLLAQMFSR